VDDVAALIERRVERVWTLAECVARLRGESPSIVLASLLYPDGALFDAGEPGRASLYRWPHELVRLADELEGR
jgi:hypothetical protein